MFKPYKAIPAEKIACRSSSWFKLGYVENSVNQDEKDFGFKTEEKVTNCINNMHYAVWYKYCDAPRMSEELPMPMASSPTSPTPPAVQVKQYSWRHNAIQNECLYDKRREFVGSGKQTNHVSLLLPQQAPLVSQAHLLSIVRMVEKSERFKGKVQQEFVIKSPSHNRGKTMTSLSYSRQKSEGEDQQCSVNTECSKSETNQLVHIYQYKTNIYKLKPSGSRKEQREIKFKRPGSANSQHSDDVISDGINQGGDVKQTHCQKALCHNETFILTYKRIPQSHIKYIQTILYPVGCNISSGYKPNRKWIKYELAKTLMYSWDRCCSIPGM